MRWPADGLKRAVYVLRYPPLRLLTVVNALLLLVVALTYLFYWRPSLQAQQFAQQNIEDARRAVTMAMQASDLTKSYGSASRSIEIIERKLQAPVKQAQLVQSVATLARSHGVRIGSESYEESKRQGDYAPLSLQISLEGRYAAVRGFLAELSGLPLWTEIEEVRMERAREAAGAVKAQIRLRVVRRSAATQGATSS